MIYSSQHKALLDANVLYSVIARDLLFWFAYYDLFIPKWSEDIINEWKEVILEKGFSEEEATKRINITNNAFKDAIIYEYQDLIPQLQLEDKDDRHVLAAAIKEKVDVIVTFNIKDFPDEYLSSFNIYAKHPDDFLVDIIDLNSDTAIEAFKEMVLSKKNPIMDEFNVLDSLRKIGLKNTADYLHAKL